MDEWTFFQRRHVDAQQGVGEVGEGVKNYKLPITKLNHGSLLYSMATVVNNTV